MRIVFSTWSVRNSVFIVFLHLFLFTHVYRILWRAQCGSEGRLGYGCRVLSGIWFGLQLWKYVLQCTEKQLSPKSPVCRCTWVCSIVVRRHFFWPSHLHSSKVNTWLSVWWLWGWNVTLKRNCMPVFGLLSLLKVYLLVPNCSCSSASVCHQLHLDIISAAADELCS